MIDSFHFTLMQLQNGHHQALQKEVRRLGLSAGQPKILECLSFCGPASPRQIGAVCMIDKATATILLDKMVKDGLVERFANPDDGRSVLIKMTEKGKKMAGKVDAAFAQVDEDVLSCLSFRERVQLMKLLEKLAAQYREADR